MMAEQVRGKVCEQSRLCTTLIYFSGRKSQHGPKTEVKSQTQKMSVTPFFSFFFLSFLSCLRWRNGIKVLEEGAVVKGGNQYGCKGGGGYKYKV